MQWISKITLIGLVVLVVGGCAGAMSGGHMGDMDHSAMTTPLAGMDHSGMMTHTETMTGTQMGNMDHSMMHVDPSQPFDAQFIDSMLEHHRGAVTMAEQALEEAEHEELRTLAEAIIAAQTQEIEQMTTWRQSWYPDLPPTEGMDMGMGEMTIREDASKPFDQRFIEAMISHHQGAIDMAKMAQQMAEHAEIKTLAAAIITAQQAEIAQMQTWLEEWYGVSAVSPYVAQLDSPVRGLSAQEVDDLRAGRGMGFARMAELNNYPGPRHVLDLQQALKLSAEQQAAIEEIFSAMQTEAQALGEQILSQEEQLSAAFADGAVAEPTLQQQVMTLAELYGQLRMAHLRAHLQVTPLLTAEQITAYNQLRGYTGNNDHVHSMQH